jgi:hypothetical protein
MTFRVFVETVIGNVTAVVTTGFTLDVAFLTMGLALDVAFLTTGLALDVAFIAARLAAGFFTNLTVTVLRAVGRRVAGFAADTAGLIQERWADNFTIGSGLVLDEVAVVFFFGFSGITTHVADWRGGGGGGGGGGVVVSSGRRHFDGLFLIEACCTGCLRKNISIFYQMYEIGRVMLFILHA